MIEWRREPKVIRFDNGSEFVSRAMHEWAHKHRIRLEYTQLSKP